MLHRSQYARDLDKLNELIDWYQKFGKPDAGQVILVKFPTEQLNKFAKHVHGTNQWRYRERILVKVPTGGQHAKTQAQSNTETNAATDPRGAAALATR